MIIDGVYPSSIHFLSFIDDVEFEAAHSRSDFGGRDGLLLHWGGSWCSPSGPKLVYRNSLSDPKFEVRMRLPGI